MISMRCRLATLIIFLALGISVATAEDAPPRTLSPLLEQILRWLPEDTETLIVAQTCQIPASRANAENDLVVPSLEPMVCGLAFGDSEFVAEGKCLRPLTGRKVKLAATGSRNFERVSSFGSLRSEGCTIIGLEEPLPEAGAAWTQLLRKEAKEVRRLQHRDVFVFASPIETEPWVKPQPWEAAYFVLLKPDTILCATSDRFLADVLRSIDMGPIIASASG